jgi:ribonucleoside-triphosphate reductase
MIARKNIRIDDKGYYKGDYNFWSKARRHDWAARRRFKTNDALQPVAKDTPLVNDDQILQ